jgi:hypothetical protein
MCFRTLTGIFFSHINCVSFHDVKGFYMVSSFPYLSVSGYALYLRNPWFFSLRNFPTKQTQCGFLKCLHHVPLKCIIISLWITFQFQKIIEDAAGLFGIKHIPFASQSIASTAQFLYAHDNNRKSLCDTGYSDMQTVFLACIATLLPLVFILLVAIGVRWVNSNIALKAFETKLRGDAN